MNGKKFAEGALSTLMLVLGLLPAALLYAAAVVGLCRFIAWCVGC